jgi:hypothetical protein
MNKKVLSIIKRIYVKLGGNEQDVSGFNTIAPVLNLMVDLIGTSSGELQKKRLEL